MGQAKLRGPHERRVEQAIQRDRDLEAARSAKETARLAAMPPAQRKQVSAKRRRAEMLTATLLGLTYAADSVFKTTPRRPSAGYRPSRGHAS